MSTRARLAAAAAVALVSLVGIGIVVVGWISDDPNVPAPFGFRETAAVAPFAGYREVRVAIGSRCVRVAVADTAERRERGLQGIGDLGPYAGLLFVQSGDTDLAFTMSGVRTPLGITWFAADGSRLDATRLRPCPIGGARCPTYRSRHPYRAALETPAGAASVSRLAPCS